MTEKKSLGKRLKRFIPLYLMMIPGAVYLIINNYIPMTGIVIAFKQFNYGKGIWGSPFIGFKNFEFLFATKDAWVITRNTLLYNVAFIVLGTASAIAVAILLNEIRSSTAKKIYQTTILVPFLISIVVVSYPGLRLPQHRIRLFEQDHPARFGAGACLLVHRAQILAVHPDPGQPVERPGL